MNDFGPLRRLAGHIKPADEGSRLRKGVIVSYATGRAVVTIGGDTTEIPNVPCPYSASPGDNVLLIFDPPLLAVHCLLT